MPDVPSADTSAAAGSERVALSALTSNGRLMEDTTVRKRFGTAARTLLLLLPSMSGAQSPASFSVAAFGPSTLEIDTRHTQGNRFEFTVTNNSANLDYITIQRSQVRSNGAEVLGVPSPEYGVSIPGGGTANIWFRWDFTGRIQPGTYQATVPFKSELTGQTVASTITYVVKAAPNETRATISGNILSAGGDALTGARLTLTDTGAGLDEPGAGPPQQPVSGNFSFSVVPGEYALTVDADGYQSSTKYFLARAGEPVELNYALDSVRARVDAANVSVRVANVASSIWTMRASADASVAATAPMGSPATSAFHGIRNGEAAWTSPFPGIRPEKAGTVSQFQAADCDATPSADGSSVAAMDYNGKVYWIDAATGETRWSSDRGADRNPKYPPNSPLGAGFFTCGAVALNSSGTLLAAGGSNGWLVMFETASGAVRWSQGYSAEIRALRFTPDGERLAVGAGDWKFRMLDANSGSALWAADNQFWPLFFVAMDPEATLVGSGSKESEFRLWDAATGELRWKKAYPAGAFVSGGSISAEGRVLVSDWGLGIRLYDADGSDIWTRKITNAAMAATADNNYIFTAGYAAGGTRGPVFYLLDRFGTILWEHRPDTARNCQVQAPFPRDFFKSVAIARSGDRPNVTIRASAACVGGSVFTMEIPVVEQ
ncbi:MAG: PQQ-binding-like beta-propeller repeat protein [Candidatus Solibacter usitatus]|nr:PQQ-binding-like beta-propeller repeat protein [Candidatus Solibacter usitatus]